ncbi:hypothetical protein [Gelatiniphilus marinus]|uniref:DUF1574 domain-containing protein n=1 Tax=Gelatiniphilus marinus TaxID=1759464 RepID=A0ABW5JQC7_9FLAO
MKEFLGYIFKILIIAFVVMYVFDKVYSYTFQNGAPRNKIQKILQLKNQHYDYAFLGSSRTENHIDCELVEKLTGKSCINLAISGGTIGDMLILMTIAESKGITFNEVFLQVDYSYNGSGISNNFRASLVPYINHKVVKQQLIENGESVFYNYIPFYRYLKYDKVVGFREFFSVLFNKKPKTDLNVGFAPKTGQGLAVSGKLPDKFKAENDELTALFRLMEKRNTKMVCFIAPYCKNIENRAFMRTLKSRVPDLKDYISVFDDNPEFFFNCGHLNIEGARAFTKIITEDLIQPTKTNL